MNYFEKFKHLKHKKEGNILVADSKNLLWIDDDLSENTVIGRSIKKCLELLTLIPEEIDINYVSQSNALDEFLGNNYSLIILDNDSYRGKVQGIETLLEIRKYDSLVPIIYTCADTREIKDSRIKENTSEIINLNNIPTMMGTLISKYMGEK